MDSLYRRISNYVNIDRTNFQDLFNLPSMVETKRPGEPIVTEGDTVQHVFVIEKGWAIRFRILDDGRRQILNFMLPGDCFDLMSLTQAASDHSVSAATEVQLRKFKAADFLNAIKTHPDLATSFWWVAIQEESILREQIIRVGRRSARERVAHMILELNRRVAAYQGQLTNFIELPVPQSLFADALGLSVVHISRTLTKLRNEGLINTTPQGIEILNRDSLVKLAEFDADYLHLKRLELVA